MLYLKRAEGAVAEGNERLAALARPLCEGLGLALVEAALVKSRGNLKAAFAVFKKGGVSLADCAAFHKAVLPRLELEFPPEKLVVEVSSPGSGRELKEGREFACFLGVPVKLWLRGASDWLYALPVAADERGVSVKRFETGGLALMNGGLAVEIINYEDIAKAKLAENFLKEGR